MDTQSFAYVMGTRLSSFDKDIQVAFDGFTVNDKLAFVRGYFDTNGQAIEVKKRNLLSSIVCTLRCKDCLFRKVVQDIIKVPCIETDNTLEFVGINSIEFLHALYKDAKYDNYNYNYASYRNLLYCWEPQWMKGPRYAGSYLNFKFMKTLDCAIAPQKAHITDTGYDLCLVKKIKEENGVIMYDTGIAVQPPLGFYFELVGRSSISKTGYIVANSVGIIDASYTGSLRVALIKINKEAPELELPARLVQLIPRQLVHMDAVEVEDLANTQRAEGGFGSSGNDSVIDI